MHKFHAILLATASAAALLSSPVLAADLRMATKAPVVAAYAPAPNWNGFYIGAFGGYAFGDVRTDTVGGGRFRDNIEGGFGGGTIGYNFQSPGSNWVFGIEADAAGGDIRTDNLGGGFTTQIDAFGTARGRVGYAFGNLLAYGTGGYAWGDLRTGAPGFRESRTLSGYAVGGGLEYAFTPNWSTKVEYMYMDFGRETFFGTDRVRLDTHTIKAGLNYRFNFGSPLVGGY